MSPSNDLPAIRWEGEDRFCLADTRFTMKDFGFFMSSADHFCLMKTRPMVEYYRRLLRDHQNGRIVELGIFFGGSVAFFSHLLRPEVLLALDIRPNRVAALDRFTAEHDHDIRAHYGVDQSDTEMLEALLRSDLGDRAPTLIIDDASHDLDLTRRSFEYLFPKLEAGGLYIIEDWAWGLFAFSPPPDRPPLAILIHELVLSIPNDAGAAISEISITPSSAVITRGPGELGEVAVSQSQNPLGRRMVEALEGYDRDS